MNVFTTFDFKPRDRSKVTLFANTGEAIVFWLSLGGLVFLAIITLFRYFTAERVEHDYGSLKAQQLEMSRTWETHSSRMLAQIDSLKFELEKNRIEIARLNALLAEMMQQRTTASAPATPERTDQRSRSFLEAFKIEKPQ